MKMRTPHPIAPWLKTTLVIVISFLAVIALVAVVLAWLSSTNRLPNNAAPLVYTAKSPIVISDPICAGGAFTFTEQYLITDGADLVSVYSVVRSAVTGNSQPRVVAGDLKAPEDFTLTLPQDIGRVLTRTIVYSNTAGIVPGHYEWWRFGRAASRTPSTYYVEFEIKPCD